MDYAWFSMFDFPLLCRLFGCVLVSWRFYFLYYRQVSKYKMYAPHIRIQIWRWNQPIIVTLPFMQYWYILYVFSMSFAITVSHNWFTYVVFGCSLVSILVKFPSMTNHCLPIGVLLITTHVVFTRLCAHLGTVLLPILLSDLQLKGVHNSINILPKYIQRIDITTTTSSNRNIHMWWPIEARVDGHIHTVMKIHVHTHANMTHCHFDWTAICF
jgi:hypothetical protein